MLPRRSYGTTRVSHSDDTETRATALQELVRRCRCCAVAVSVPPAPSRGLSPIAHSGTLVPEEQRGERRPRGQTAWMRTLNGPFELCDLDNFLSFLCLFSHL